MRLFVGAKAVIVNSNEEVLIVRESGSYEEGTNEGKWRFRVGELKTQNLFLMR